MSEWEDEGHREGHFVKLLDEEGELPPVLRELVDFMGKQASNAEVLAHDANIINAPSLLGYAAQIREQRAAILAMAAELKRLRAVLRDYDRRLYQWRSPAQMTTHLGLLPISSDGMRQLVDAAARLEAENRELRADRERLDWLSRLIGFDVTPAYWALDGDLQRIHIERCTADDRHEDLRTAIDAARRAKESE